MAGVVILGAEVVTVEAVQEAVRAAGKAALVGATEARAEMEAAQGRP